MTRNLAKMANKFKNLLDHVVKSLASKEDIDSLKLLIMEQSETIKESELKITKLEEKVATNEEAMVRLNKGASSFEGSVFGDTR